MGPDGKELIPQESPKVNGYGFVATPSPAPGKNFYCCWVFGGGGFLFIYFFSPRDIRGLLLHLLMYCLFSIGVLFLV